MGDGSINATCFLCTVNACWPLKLLASMTINSYIAGGFLSVIDQFFLNLAINKAAMDAGAMIRRQHRYGYDPQRQYVRDSGQQAG